VTAAVPLGDLILTALRTARHEERVTARYTHGEASRDALRCANRLALQSASAMWTRLAQVAPDETGTTEASGPRRPATLDDAKRAVRP
jgi:hypothetical protein